MRVTAIGAYALLMTLLAGCVMIPKKAGVRGKITNAAITLLQEGKTTRDETLMRLGLPDQADRQGKWFIYEWATAWDVCFYNACDEFLQDFILLIEFDGQGVVSNTKRRKGKINRLDREFLKNGSTHRDDILLNMGLPDQCDKQGRRFVYGRSFRELAVEWEELIRVVADNEILQEAILLMDETQEIFMTSIIIEFDDQGIVSSIEEPENREVSSSEERAWGDLYRLICDAHEGSLSESNFYTNQQDGFSIQFPAEWSTGCRKGAAIIEVEKSVYTGFWRFIRIDPDYHLKLWIEVHTPPEYSDVWNLAQLPTPSTKSTCPTHWICNKTIEAVDSGKILLEGIHAFREVHRVKEIRQERRPYQLYKLGAHFFGNQLYDLGESNHRSQLLTYWFLQDDRLYQVTGEITGRKDKGREKFEKAANEWQPILEKSIRSFHFIN